MQEQLLRTDPWNLKILQKASIVHIPQWVASGDLTSTGAWNQRAHHNVINLETLGLGRAPNVLEIIPWMESAVAGASCTFNVYAYKGKNGDMKRICKVSGILGAYKKRYYADGTAISTVISGISAHYLDTLNVTDYWNEVAVHDAGGKSGMASLSFDLRAYNYIVLEVEFIGADGGKLGFDGSGY